MTDKNDDVFTWACNLTDAIVAGDYKLPKEMTFAMNMLQDAVYDELNRKHLRLKDCVSKDFSTFKDKARKEREDAIRDRYWNWT